MYITTGKTTVNITVSDVDELLKIDGISSRFCHSHDSCSTCPIRDFHRKHNIGCDIVIDYLLANNVNLDEDFEVREENQ